MKTVFALLTLLAITAQAQITTGTAGTFLDGSLPPTQRVQKAYTVVYSGTDSTSVSQAVIFMLSQRPVGPLLSAYPTFVDTVIDDPTVSGKITDNIIWELAISWKAETIPAIDDRIAFDQAALSGTLPTGTSTNNLKYRLASLLAGKARGLNAKGNYADTISLLTPVVGWNTGDVLPALYEAKLRTSASDLLSWAKFYYYVQDFGHTQAGVDAILGAFRLQGIGTAAFVQYQTTGEGLNPLAGTTLPAITLLGNNDRVKALNLSLTGDSTGALRLARQMFSLPQTSAQLSVSSAFMSQILRNADGNLKRANDFSVSASKGLPYNIVELGH